MLLYDGTMVLPPGLCKTCIALWVVVLVYLFVAVAHRVKGLGSTPVLHALGLGISAFIVC